jgi:hypothetical protein
MAPKFFSKLLLFTLIVALLLFVLPARAFADSPVLQEQVFKFYLDPALVPDINFAKAVLPKYVADMNTILSKNTNRRLLFDPETGIILALAKPQTDSGPNPLPTSGFELWVYAVQTTRALSHGGYASMDKSGAGVVSGLHWTHIYDPDQLMGSEVTDYILQIDHMLHELAHVFGAGIGEYYSLATVNDTTGVDPLSNIRLSDPADSYWSTKPDFMTDPLLLFTHASTREAYLDSVRYSNLTAAVINGAYRNGLQSFGQYTVRVLDQDGVPVEGATVRVWNVRGYSPYQSDLLFDDTTDENGQLLLSWGGLGSPRNASNLLRLIKVYKGGISITPPRYVSIFDMDSAMLVSKESEFVVTLQSQPVPLLSNVQTQVETFLSSGRNDGWVLESANGSNKGGSLNASAGVFLLGDDAANKQYRAILSFDTSSLSSLPEGAEITSITLQFKYAGKKGTLPFSTHGKLLVDVINGSFSNDPALQKGDFQLKGSKNNLFALTKKTVDGWYIKAFAPTQFQYINTAGVTQFRLRFKLDDNNDFGADFLKIYSGDADEANRPQLIIEYYVQ